MSRVRQRRPRGSRRTSETHSQSIAIHKADIEFGVPRISVSQERVVRGEGGRVRGWCEGEWNILSVCGQIYNADSLMRAHIAPAHNAAPRNPQKATPLCPFLPKGPVLLVTPRASPSLIICSSSSSYSCLLLLFFLLIRLRLRLRLSNCFVFVFLTGSSSSF